MLAESTRVTLAPSSVDSGSREHWRDVWNSWLMLLVKVSKVSWNQVSWASYQMRNIAGCACSGNAGNVFPAPTGWRSRHASRHVRDARAVMHAGIANKRFPLKSVVGETFRAFSAHAQPTIYVSGKRPILGVYVWLTPWWRHQMETFFALLALCEGNPPATGGFRHIERKWRGALMFSLICTWTNSWTNNRDAGDLRRRRAHHDVTVMRTEMTSTISFPLYLPM